MNETCVVVGVDGSPEAHEALRWATRLTVTQGGKVVAVHALGLLGDMRRTEVAATMEHEWCAALRMGRVPYRLVVRDGNAVDVLVDVAAEEDAGLLVVGSRGTGETPALALGSTSLQLLRQAPVPVLVVPGCEQAGRHLALRRILVAIDGSAACLPALDVASDLARAFDARVELVEAVEEAPVFPLGPSARVSSEGERDAARRAWCDAQHYYQRLDARHVPVHLTVQRGPADEVVRSVAAATDADLVIAASQGAGDPTRGLLDSVSRNIVRVAHRPTLVIPVPASAPAALAC